MAGTKFILVTGALMMCVVSATRHSRDASISPSLGVCGYMDVDGKGAVEPLKWWLPEETESCTEEEWLCRDGHQCIHINATCSGEPECADESDESPRFCGCEKDHFRCGDLCFNCSQRCDKFEHCLHGEDEKDCLTHTCPPDTFQCVSDGICVPNSALCNHTSECHDRSDESDCTRFRSCYSTEFQCDNGQCVRPYAVCDNFTDCKDKSDERDCKPSDFVTCKSGKRIHKFWQCNNYPDCSEKYYFDDTDELSCTCTKDHFRCSNDRCIYTGNVCDSVCDCADCGDELNHDCTGSYVNVSGVVECLKGESVLCNGRCIARKFVCDDINHCQGRDLTEMGCYNHEEETCMFPETAKQEEIHYFQCDDLRCLPAIFLCDGRRHCLDGEDEVNCGENGACGPDGFLCLNGSCVPREARCNGIEDCRFGLDEEHCEAPDQSRCGPDQWACMVKHECIPLSERCNSHKDCADGSDERFCEDNTCTEDQWRCTSGHCVPKSVRCDSIFNCIDKSDEKYCDKHVCRSGERRCTSGQCVAQEAWCNDIQECIDNSDEENCERRECTPNEFQCRNGQCVPLAHRCLVFADERQSCLDLSHLINCTEAKCGKGFLQCLMGQCYDERLKCDGVAQCPDTWDDEDNCPYMCSASNRRCKCLDVNIKCPSLGLTKFPHVEDNISKYYFAHNRIGATLHKERIEGHQKAIYLNLCDNHITQLGNGTLSGMPLLMTLLLCCNNITNITYGNFMGLTKLRNLDLTANQITRLGPRAFAGLDSLPKLDLRHQELAEIAEYAFEGLYKLKILLLSYNRLTSLTHRHIFAGLPVLETLVLSHNRLTTISHPDTFVGLPLRTLMIDENPLEYVDEMVFQPLHDLDDLSTPEFRFCCLPHRARECLPRTEEFSSCEDLMSNLVLRVFVWVVGFVALFGNTFVIVWRLLYPSSRKKNHSMLFVNLAMGDLLMGVYLLVIAGIDLRFRGVYRLHERWWRSSYLCKAAGFLSTFSSEASVFTLTVITLDRLTILLSPFGMRSVNEGLAKRVMIGVWLVAFILAAVPLFSPFMPYFNNFYGRSGVCLALHITNDKPNGWEYSVFIFLVLNLLSFSIIAVSYIMIYAGARDTPLMESGKTKHGKDREMGRRVTYIVGTDAACWLPIILLGIVSLSGVQISRRVFAWVAVFVLPVNAALNPLLYTFFTDPVRKRLKVMRESISSWRTRSTRSSVISGVRITSTYRGGRVTSEVTDIPLTAGDGKVHTKATICVYTPATSTSTQVTHFIHDPTDQGTKRLDECSNQNGKNTTQILDRPRSAPQAEVKVASEAEEEEAIVPLETLTGDRPAPHRTSGRYSRKKNTVDQRYD